MADDFSFPKHKELFNDMYYQEEDAQDPNKAKDYQDPNDPFVSQNPFVPGGILAQYEEKAGLTAKDIMEQDYWNSMRDMHDKAAQYFNVVNKNEKDVMNQTKNYKTRIRLQRQVEFTEDFRKRFMTREYGNYEKYEDGKNQVTESVEGGEHDMGYDHFIKKKMQLDHRVKNTIDSEQTLKKEKSTIENLLQSDRIADNSIETKFDNLKA